VGIATSHFGLARACHAVGNGEYVKLEAMKIRTKDEPGIKIRNGGRRAAGFTLVEVMITGALLMLLIGAGLTTLLFLGRSSVRLADHTSAMALIQGRMESVRAATYNPPQSPFTSATVTLTNNVSLSLGGTGRQILVPGTVRSIIQPVASGHLVTIIGTFQTTPRPLTVSLQSIVNDFSGGP
jgi:type II secretory pathway pseudopilin PulG